MTIQQKINSYLLQCLKAQLYQGNICIQGWYGSLVMKKTNILGCLLNKPKQCRFVDVWKQSMTQHNATQNHFRVHNDTCTWWKNMY